MAPKGKCSKIKAFKKKLIDEPTNEEHSDNESLKVVNVLLDPEVRVPPTRAATKAAQTQAHVDIPSQSDEERNDESDDILPQMTPSGMKSSSEEGSQDRGDAQSSVAPLVSEAPDPTYRWGVEGTEAIFKEGLQPKGQGKIVRYIYEEPRVINDGLSCVPGLEDTMTRYGLDQLIDKLG